VIGLDRLIEESHGIIQSILDKYDNVAVACSFGKDSMVALQLCLDLVPDIQVFSVMTRYKPWETLELKRKVTKDWNLNIKTYSYDGPIKDDLHLTNPDECCRLLKVEPTRRAIEELGLDAWITGLRKDEGNTRNNYRVIEKHNCGLVKVNPILNWSETDIWRYHAVKHLPVNPLYMQGYRSLGCLKCSKPHTEQERGGRWQGTTKQGGECGIHTTLLTGK
jgi:phosphoadenosine phosphosulfate reductase